MLWLLQVSAADSAARITEDGATASAAIAASMDQLWQDVLLSGGGSGGLYGAIANLGIFFGVGTLLLWIVNWAKNLLEDNYIGSFHEIIWPLIVIVLLSNQASVLAQCTLQLRQIINQTNQMVLQSTSSSIRLQDAYKQIMQELGTQDVAEGMVSQCASIADPAEQQACLDNAKSQAQTISGQLNQQPSNGFQKFMEGIGQFPGHVLQTAVRGWLMAFGIAFQWITEISMLLTALLGPLAVGGTLLPVGQKAIFAWLTGFFSIGMVKLSFNIINGLVATLVLNAGANDPMIFAFATGLLSPILALTLAAGGGMAVFNSLSSLSTFGMGRILPLTMR